MNLTGVSYRLLNSWEREGLIPDTREGKGQWRRFTVHQFLGVMILAELRRKFDIRLADLRWVGQQLLRQDSRLLFEAAGKISGAGLPVLLLSDLKNFALIDTTTAISEFMASDRFAREPEGAFVILKINSLVKKLMEEFGVQMGFEEHGFGYQTHGNEAAQSPEDEKILALLRSVQFNKVEVDLVNGQVRLVTAEQTIPGPAVQEILTLTKTAGFQTVEVIRPDGKITQARRKISAKPEELKLGLRTRRG